MTGSYRSPAAVAASRAYPIFMDGRQACADKPAEMFFPELARDNAKAQRICRKCPLVEPCARWAVDTNQLDGIWGATTPRQRREIHRRNGGRR